MFDSFRKNRINNIMAPVAGKSIPLDKVPDKVFAEKMLGDGVAFIFDGDIIYSPCNGDVIMIADTGHAFAFRTDNGTEVLLHIGLDTVNLKGEGMDVLVENNTRIKAGRPILKIDRKIMSDKNINLTTPLIISNMQEYDIDIKKPRKVSPDSVVIKTKKSL